MTRIWKGEKLSFWFHTSHSIRNKSHFSQFQSLCSTKISIETLQNLPVLYIYRKKPKVAMSVVHLMLLLIFFPNECPDLC